MINGKNISGYPKHWEVLPFSEVVNDSTAGNHKIPTGDYLSSGSLPIIDQGQQLIGGYASDSELKAGVELPAIIFGDHTRVFKFIDFDFAIGADGAKILEPKDGIKLDKKFLYHYLNNIFIESAGYSRHFKFLKEMYVPLPPLEEQKRIAAILDKADAIRRKRQQAIKLADDFLRSVFLEMFGDPVTNPKGWEVRSVGEVADCIVPGRDKPKSFTGSTPWVTTNDLNHLGFTHCSKSNIGLSEEEIKNVRARVVPKNSVLMTCVGDLGVVSISANDMVINQQLHAFLPSEKYASTYLAYALSFQKGYMTSMASSTTLPYMNKTICNGVPVAIAPLPLQLKFESILMRVNEFKNKLQGQEINPLFNSLSQKAFSGELQL